LSEPDTLRAAVTGGARYVGFVFYPPSPRAVAPAMAGELARLVPTGVRSVGLFVDPDDAFLEHVIGQVPLDVIQLHGSENPRRIVEIKARYRMPVMKAVKIGGPDDLAAAAELAESADRLLFDAKPPSKTGALPGGNGVAFDWTLLAGRRWSKPWMLSGGLTPENVAEAVRVTGATEVDVSSGVEDRPGHKDAGLIRAFLSSLGGL
jgi:phosphoribosylanthranilate isomerase